MIRSAQRVVFLQGAVTAAITATVLALGNIPGAISALLGGGVGLVGSLVGALSLYGFPDSGPKRVLGALVRVEVFKVGTVVLLLAVVFGFYPNVAALPFFTAFITSLMVYWVALIVT